VFTAPVDLPVSMIGNALADGWSFTATSLQYQPVGFGSHHWLATDARGSQLFVTVDDQAMRLHGGADTREAAFGRLRRALETALSLHRDAGLGFVVAPVAAGSGSVVARLTDQYSLTVHPYLDGAESRPDGTFESRADALAVVRLLARLHAAQASPLFVTPPDPDPFAVRLAGELETAIERTGEGWDGGPHGERARQLLARHGPAVSELLAAYDRLANQVAARPERMVITHGEPNGANVLRTADGFVFVDWESVLLAPPERDLWGLAEADASVLADYSAETGTVIDQDALRLYRLRYDLAEISGYITWFSGSHGDTADTAEAWRNLQYYLRPAERWPELLAG
jgi:spectinomycin phosphotransferase